MLDAFILHIDKFFAILTSIFIMFGMIYLVEKETPDREIDGGSEDFQSPKANNG